MHDHRVFRHNSQWWGATILSGGGVSSGGIVRITQERAYATCLYEPEILSRTFSIPAGWLNHLRHQTIVDLLNKAEESGFRWEMIGYNQPDPNDYFGYTPFTDTLGLRWMYREVDAPALLADGTMDVRKSLDFVCLDDSALRMSIGLPEQLHWEHTPPRRKSDLISAMVDSLHMSYRPLDHR